METPKTEEQKNIDRAAKVALTPHFEKMLGRKPANFETVSKMEELLKGLDKPDPVEPAIIIEPNEILNPIIETLEGAGAKSLERLGISVVIPYLASAARGEELKYALRSWAENFGDCHIIIIGDKPDFISDEVIHIPAAVQHESPQLDIVAKLMQIIASDLVTENFIWSNDDIYLVNFLEEAEISALKSVGTLGQLKIAGSGYQERIEKTKAALLAARYPTHNYATHTPFFFNKEKMAKVIDKYKADQEPLLISCLYYNSVFPKEQPVVISGGAEGDHVVYVYRANPSHDVLRDAIDSRKLLNHNNEGYDAVLPFLEVIFPDSCKFEI